MSQDTNLYDFLRRLQRDSEGQPGAITLTDDERRWLNGYLTDPGIELHFKATPTGEMRDSLPVFIQNFAISGNPEDIFVMLTEACIQNPAFASLILSAGRFMTMHVKQCPECMMAVHQVEQRMGKRVPISPAPTPTLECWFSWQFNPHR